MSSLMFLSCTFLLLVKWSLGQLPGSIADIATNNDDIISCSDASPKSATTSIVKPYYVYQFFITVTTGTIPKFNTCGSSMDTRLFFYDSSGNTFDSKDDGGTCSLREYYTPGTSSVRLISGGTYYVAVSHYSTGYGSFELTMEECSNALVDTTSCNTQSIVGSITTEKQIKYYNFTHCGGTIEIDTCDSSTIQSSILYMHDSNGNYIGYANNANTDQGISTNCASNYETWITSLTAGNYYLGIGSDISDTGTYDIDLNCCSNEPTDSPSQPSQVSSISPINVPTQTPSSVPSNSPTQPTLYPSVEPTQALITNSPTKYHTITPTIDVSEQTTFTLQISTIGIVTTTDTALEVQSMGSNDDSQSIAIGVSVSIVFLLIILIIVVLWLRRMNKRKLIREINVSSYSNDIVSQSVQTPRMYSNDIINDINNITKTGSGFINDIDDIDNGILVDVNNMNDGVTKGNIPPIIPPIINMNDGITKGENDDEYSRSRHSDKQQTYNPTTEGV